jgi:hypothetical protein
MDADDSVGRAAQLIVCAWFSTSLERTSLGLTQSSAAHSVRSPPPCEEGSGMGVVRLMH